MEQEVSQGTFEEIIYFENQDDLRFFWNLGF
jgi:hypothetical protein